MIRLSELKLSGEAGAFHASVKIESDRGPTGDLWFDVQGAELPHPGMAASAFVAACVPLAAYLEEDVTIDEPIDQEFAMRVDTIIRGYGRMRGKPPVRVVAESVRIEGREGRIVASSFSGGVDSFLTLRTYLDPDGLHPIGALATILGFDTAIDATEKHVELLQWTAELAETLGLHRFVMRTNLRSVFDPFASWGYVTHVGCIAAFAFLLSGSVHTYLIPSSFPIDNLFPHASHALLDSAWIAGPTRTVCDAWEMNRFEKTKVIVDWPPAIAHLRVCSSKNSQFRNCGRCEKCVRTMLTLRILGASETPIFPHPLKPELLRNVRIHTSVNQRRWKDLRAHALATPGCEPFAADIRFALLKSRVRAVRYWIQDFGKSKSE